MRAINACFCNDIKWYLVEVDDNREEMYLHPLGSVVADLRGHETETSGGRVPRWRKSHETLQHTRRHFPNPKFNHTTQLDYQIGGESHGKWRNRSESFCSFVRWFWIKTHTKRHKLEMKGWACSHYSIRPAHVLLAHQMEQRRLGNNKKHIIVTTHKRYKTVKTCVTARLV